MIEFPLELRLPDSRGRQPVAGWFLPGRDVSQWVDWLCSNLEERAGEVSLMPIPVALDRARAAGLFVADPGIGEPGNVGRALPYRLIADRLFVPADAELRFPLTDAEIAAEFVSDINVLHPRIGLVSTDREDAIRLKDLLDAPARNVKRWNFAKPGPAELAGIQWLGGAQTNLVPEQSIEGGREDIGTGSARELEPTDDEKNLWRRGAIATQDILYRSILGWMRMVPHTGARESWINRLEDWAAEKLSDLNQQRKNEVDRLVELMSKDFDLGLRYAIPIGGDNSHRGQARPGAALSRRDVDFNLADLAGGGPVDSWDLTANQTDALGELYRDAANRELTLNRFRRAAYIFARLLNDYHSAAEALKRGHYFQEAAALYRDKLSADRSAAECLREGGLHEEAAIIYQELGEWELLGDMYRELEYQEQAVAAFEQAIEEASERGDTFMAARIVDQKLDDAGRARAMLRNDWPRGIRARASLSEYFKLLNRDAENEETMRVLKSLIGQVESQHQRIGLAEVVSELPRYWTNVDLIGEFNDATRVLVGRYLEENGPNVEAATKVIRSLDVGDRLLGRDAGTFSDRRTKRKRAPASPVIHAESGPVRIEAIGVDHLPNGFIAQKAVDSRLGLIVIGLRNGKPAIWLPRHKTMEEWDAEPNWYLRDALLLSGSESKDALVALHLSTGAMLMPRNIEIDGQKQLAVTHWASPVMVTDPEARVFEFEISDREGVLRRSSDGNLEYTKQIALPHTATTRWARGSDLALMRATSKAVYITIFNQMIRVAGVEVARVEIPAPAVSIVKAPRHTKPRLMFNMEFGAGLLRDDENRWNKIRYFASDMPLPFVQFMRTGHLVAVNSEKIRVYNVGRYEIAKVWGLKGPEEKVVDVLAGPRGPEIQVITEHRILTYRIVKQ